MFRALCARHQEVKIVLYSIWYRHTIKKSCVYPVIKTVRCLFTLHHLLNLQKIQLDCC